MRWFITGDAHGDLDRIYNWIDRMDFDRWFFGHYHVDKQLDDKYTCLLNDFIEL